MGDGVERLLEVHKAHTEWLLVLACLGNPWFYFSKLVCLYYASCIIFKRFIVCVLSCILLFMLHSCVLS